MKDSYLIKRVIIDVVKSIITIEDNGADIPTQSYIFSEEDEWFDIKGHKGEVLLVGNIFWDERWGFQFATYEEVDGKTQIASDYTNPDTIDFVNNDKRGFYEVRENDYKQSEEYKKMRIQQLTQSMLQEVAKQLEPTVNKVFQSGAVDLDEWDDKINPMLLPKAIMIAFLEREKNQFRVPGSMGKQVDKEAKNIGYHI